MKSINKISSLTLLIVGGFLGLFSSQIWAQTDTPPVANPGEIALTAVPPRLGDDYSLVVKPGQKTQTTIEVRNPSAYPATVETFARDFIIAPDGETPIAVEDEVSSKWSLAQWLTVTPNNVALKPYGSAALMVTINVPEDALPGGRYAMVLHKPAMGTGETETTGAKITAQVGTLLYVVVDGEIAEEAEIKDFAFKKFSEFGPVAYSYKIENNSSLHIRPETKIVIKNMFGKEMATLAPEQKNIFPDSEREMKGEWNAHWGFGRYTAHLSGIYGASSGKELVPVEARFWIVPVRTILAILLVIILIIIVSVTTRKKYAKMLDLEEEKLNKLDEKLKKARQEDEE